MHRRINWIARRSTIAESLPFPGFVCLASGRTLDHRANVENVGDCLAQAVARLTDPMLCPPSPNLAGQRAGLVSVQPLESVTTGTSVGVTWKPWHPGLPIRQGSP